MIEPNAATDLAVAKACGIPAQVVGDVCYRMTDKIVCGGVLADKFRPTTDMRHAKEAAEIIDHCRDMVLTRHDDEWECDFGVPERGPTLELAICEAILATTKGGGRCGRQQDGFYLYRVLPCASPC